jgi:hypothetical protein
MHDTNPVRLACTAMLRIMGFNLYMPAQALQQHTHMR